MYFDGTCYLFDLLKIDPFEYGLGDVMQNNNIVCNNVFDT